MTVPMQTLEATRVNKVMQALQDAREVPQNLRFSQRIPDVPATDAEIIGSYTGRVHIADLIADDQQAVTYSSGKMEFVTYAIPNLKSGVNINQAMLNHLETINANGGIDGDDGIFRNYERRTLDGLLLSVRQRKEALFVGMAIDGFSYDRLGIKMSNVSWGMPSDLKVTVATGWDTAASATPVADILAVKLTGSIRYGIEYDRVTMSTQAFRYMIATTEFQNKARMYLAPNVSFVNLPLADLDFQRRLATQVLGMELELYDTRYWAQSDAGVLTSAPFLPITKVVLSSTSSDNDQMTWDFANTPVTEGIVARLAGGLSGMIGGNLGGQRYGPVAYATVRPDLNPPSITYWGVARGFPRKHYRQATAVLTVGSFSDAIPVGEPF